MAKAIQMPHMLWEEMRQIVMTRLKGGSLRKPIVFALYTDEHDHHKVISYREITTVKVIGDYQKGKYDYCYSGIKNQDFYPHKGTGKWFSGTLVVGDGTELEEGDKQWIFGDKMDFRIKMEMDPVARLAGKAYFIDFPVVPVDLQ